VGAHVSPAAATVAVRTKQAAIDSRCPCHTTKAQ
jgi:hypothetical protein